MDLLPSFFRGLSHLGSTRSDVSRLCELLIPWVSVELEMRVAEEPLSSDLDVAGLRAQVLGRITVLEEREREKENLLAELVPAMKAWGHDTGAVKAVLGR